MYAEIDKKNRIQLREGDIIQLKQDTMKKRKRHESSQCQASFSQNQDFKHRKRFDKDIDEVSVKH